MDPSKVWFVVNTVSVVVALQSTVTTKREHFAIFHDEVFRRERGSGQVERRHLFVIYRYLGRSNRHIDIHVTKWPVE